MKIPQIKLAIALPLVGTSTAAIGAGAAASGSERAGPVLAARDAAKEVPHFEQYCAESGLAVPHCGQNMDYPLLLPPIYPFG